MALAINCDMGEAFGLYQCGDDEGIMPYITLANVACGFHASDFNHMRKTVQLAKKHGVLFYPFFLEGVAANLKLNQADGIHPNEQGTQIIVRGMLPYVQKLLEQIKAKPQPAVTN